MDRSFDTYTERVLDQFNQIDNSSYREIIRFYEQNREELKHLEIESYVDVQITYSSALFEIGRYNAFIKLVDPLIEMVIFQNIVHFKGEDIYQKLLFKKAAAHYQILELKQSQHILIELLKMDPQNAAVSYLLKRCLIKIQPDYLGFSKGISIFLFFVSALIIGIELLAIRPFFKDWSQEVEIMRSSVFISGIFILLGAEIWHRIRSYKSVNKMIETLGDP